MRAMQNDSGTAGLDTMVLQDETAGGTGDCGGGARRNTHHSGKLAGRLFSLDEEHPRVADFAAAMVGPQDSCVALPGVRSHHGRERDTCGVRNLWIKESGARPRRARHMV